MQEEIITANSTKVYKLTKGQNLEIRLIKKYENTLIFADHYSRFFKVYLGEFHCSYSGSLEPVARLCETLVSLGIDHYLSHMKTDFINSSLCVLIMLFTPSELQSYNPRL